MTARLEIRRRDGKLVVVLEKDGERVSVRTDTPATRADAHRWATRGLVELTEHQTGEGRPRHTRPDDPRFFGRLAEYSRAHGFQASVVDDEEQLLILSFAVQPTPRHGPVTATPTGAAAPVQARGAMVGAAGDVLVAELRAGGG
jgi:hypothetical protein